MNKILFSLALLFGLVQSNAQDKKGITLTVVIENVLNDKGSILSALHTQTTFMKSMGIENKKDEAKQGGLTLVFNNVEPGTYAISALHDENNNSRMDFEANGMPKENYAMSQNPMLMGPPTFNDVKFIVDNEDLDLVIRF
jgi:uncharacterized protein (DUF2141 family)